MHDEIAQQLDLEYDGRHQQQRHAEQCHPIADGHSTVVYWLSRHTRIHGRSEFRTTRSIPSKDLRADHIQELVCRGTTQELRLIVNTGPSFVRLRKAFWFVRERATEYPIVKGVPCFVHDSGYSASFGEH